MTPSQPQPKQDAAPRHSLPRMVRLTEIERRYLVLMWRDAALKIRRLARVADRDAKAQMHRAAEKAEQRAKFLADRTPPNGKLTGAGGRERPN